MFAICRKLISGWEEGTWIPDDEIDEMIRTAIYLHIDERHRLQALQWLDERFVVREASKDDSTSIRRIERY